MPDALTRGAMVKVITEAVVSQLSAAGRLIARPGDRTLIAAAVTDALYGNLPVDTPSWRTE